MRVDFSSILHIRIKLVKLEQETLKAMSSRPLSRGVKKNQV